MASLFKAVKRVGRAVEFLFFSCQSVMASSGSLSAMVHNNKTGKQKKSKLLHIPKTVREGWADVTRSTPSSPEARTSPFRTANELSRSVNFLLNVHEQNVDHFGSASSSSTEDLPPTDRKSSLPEHSLSLPPDERPRRSSMSRIFETGLGRRSPHSSAGNLLTAVLSKTLRKK